ncbi:e3 ubiquitin-protein ligase hrd-1 [Fagus crenata]
MALVCNVFLGGKQFYQTLPTGTLKFRCCERYQNHVWNPDGVVVEHRRTHWRTLLSVEIPTQALIFPVYHQAQILNAVSSLNLDPRTHCMLVDRVLSLAQHMMPGPLTGYYIVADLEYVQVEHQEVEPLDGVEYFFANLDVENDDSDSAQCASALVDKLMNERSFVVSDNNSELDLDTCGICLDEFSSTVGAKVTRMHCSHLYHQSCILPWLKKQNTCPTCRRIVEDEE